VTRTYASLRNKPPLASRRIFTPYSEISQGPVPASLPGGRIGQNPRPPPPLPLLHSPHPAAIGGCRRAKPARPTVTAGPLSSRGSGWQGSSSPPLPRAAGPLAGAPRWPSTARAPGGAGRWGGGPGPPGWSGGCGGRMGGAAAGSGGQAHGRRRLSSAPASASVGVPSLWRPWQRPWWSAACLDGGLRQLVRLGSSPRGVVDGGGARRAPGRFVVAPVQWWLGVKTERMRTDSSETVFVTIFFLDSEPERIVCGYEYEIGVYR
jgi:hypothetical protein